MPFNDPVEMEVSGSAQFAVSQTTLPSESFNVAEIVAASAALRMVSAASKEALPDSGSQSDSICMFSICTCGCAASSTERNSPCRRQKSWSSSHEALEYS